MRGGKWALALVFLLALKGTGVLPQGREMEQRKLISALAVDGGGTVSVTAVTGVRTSEDEEAEVLTGTGDSLAQACRELRGGSSRRAYLGQTEQLLLGAGTGVGETLEFVLADRELRLDTLLYIIKGPAGKALADSAPLVSEEAGGQDPRGRTVGEILPRLAQGECALAPALASGENGTLEPAGWAVLGPAGILGYLEGEAALGAELLSGMGKERVVTLPGGAVELLTVRTWAGEGVLRCSMGARALQGKPAAEELAAWGEDCLRAALAPGWDCWGLDREQGALEPWAWEDWKDSPVKELDVEVTGRLVEP